MGINERIQNVYHVIDTLLTEVVIKKRKRRWACGWKEIHPFPPGGRTSTLRSINHLSCRHLSLPREQGGEPERWNDRRCVSSPSEWRDSPVSGIIFPILQLRELRVWVANWFAGTSPEVSKPWLKPSSRVSLDSVVCYWAKWHNESETLGELLAYPLYTFLMNRPQGLIKGEKKINCFSQQLQIIYIAFALMANKRAKECGDSPGWL